MIRIKVRYGCSTTNEDNVVQCLMIFVCPFFKGIDFSNLDPSVKHWDDEERRCNILWIIFASPCVATIVVGAMETVGAYDAWVHGTQNSVLGVEEHLAVLQLFVLGVEFQFLGT